jgi:threonine dehydrogenase-like Zn-dependent dehydrogenase
MFALQIVSPSNVIYAKVDKQEVRDNDIRIKIKSSAICGTDLRNIKEPRYPFQIPGHECSGYVIELGKNVFSDIQCGDMVTVFPMIGCMKCGDCKKQDYRECRFKKSIGIDLPGSFAEEIVIDKTFVIPVKRKITFDQASLVEYLSCSYRLSMEILEFAVRFDEPILIIGDGPIALANVQVLTYLGYSDISVIGKHDDRLKFAKNFGASRVLKFNNLKTLSLLRKFKVCVYSVRADNTLSSVLGYLEKDAYLFLQARILDKEFEYKIRSLKFIFGRAFTYYIDDFYAVIDLIADGHISTNCIISKRIGMYEAARFLSDKHYNRDSIKTIISI